MFDWRLAMMNADEWSNCAVSEGRGNEKGNSGIKCNTGKTYNIYNTICEKKKKLEKNIKKKEKRDCQEINHQDWP
jgi:hypothetical protein